MSIYKILILFHEGQGLPNYYSNKDSSLFPYQVKSYFHTKKTKYGNQIQIKFWESF